MLGSSEDKRQINTTDLITKYGVVMRKRDFARMARFNALKQKEHMDERREKIYREGESILDYRVEKAMESVAPKDDVVMISEPKADAIHKVVNHAHQRSANKKW